MLTALGTGTDTGSGSRRDVMLQCKQAMYSHHRPDTSLSASQSALFPAEDSRIPRRNSEESGITSNREFEVQIPQLHPKMLLTPCPTVGSFSSIAAGWRSEEHTSELQSQSNLVCRLLLEKKKRAAPSPASTSTTSTTTSGLP